MPASTDFAYDNPEVVFLSSIHSADSGQLLAMAVALSNALAQGQSQTQLARLGAFFTIVGDTLSMYALEPGQAEGANLSLGENL